MVKKVKVSFLLRVPLYGKGCRIRIKEFCADGK